MRVAVLQLGRRRVVRESPGRLAQLLDAGRELRLDLRREIEVASRRTQRLVDAREHAAQAVRAVRREQPQPLGLLSCTEFRQRLLERLTAQHRALRIVELAEARVEPCRERIALQQPQAEAVDRRDPRAVELTGEILAPALRERSANARAQLARRATRVRDDEDRVDVEPAVADGADEALDEDGGLARAGARGDEHLAGCLDRCELLLVHVRSILQIGQRSHHAGHASPFGSCLTSPSPMRTASRCAVAFALSTPPRTCPRRGSRSSR